MVIFHIIFLVLSLLYYSIIFIIKLFKKEISDLKCTGIYFFKSAKCERNCQTPGILGINLPFILPDDKINIHNTINYLIWKVREVYVQQIQELV